jgi:hypothetical protein
MGEALRARQRTCNTAAIRSGTANPLGVNSNFVNPHFDGSRRRVGLLPAERQIGKHRRLPAARRTRGHAYAPVLITSAPGADWPSNQKCNSMATPSNFHSTHTHFCTGIGVFD